jgi:rfaE bifunctional protein nucleotidyltransferase chain/domain
MTVSEIIENKIVSGKNLERIIALCHFKQKKVVFTNGCFDILHQGHVEYLAKAAEQGDILIVGLNSDHSVRLIKGSGRPVQNEQSRSLLLASLQFIDYIVLFDEATPYNLIRLIQPDVLVKGADYKPEDIVGYDIVQARGGKIITIELTPGFSTTDIISKLNRL